MNNINAIIKIKKLNISGHLNNIIKLAQLPRLNHCHLTHPQLFHGCLVHIYNFAHFLSHFLLLY